MDVTLKYRPLVQNQNDPTQGQRAFHEDRYRVRYRWLLAGTGGGKTYSAVYEDLSWMLLLPGSAGLVIEPDYRMVRRILEDKFRDILGLRPGQNLEASPIVTRYNRTDHQLELVNGSRCWFVGVDRDPSRLEGPDIDWAHADEVRIMRHWPDVQSNIVRRLRGSTWWRHLDPEDPLHPRQRGLEPEMMVGAWYTTHSPTEEQAEEARDNPDAKLYQWSTIDAYESGVISKTYLDDVLRRHTGAAREAVVHGHYALPEGLVYDDLVPDIHLQAPPHPGSAWADHVVYGVDWGYTDPCVMGAWLIHGSTAWGVDEFYGDRRVPRELVREAQALEERWGRGVWWCGPDQPAYIELFRQHGLDARAYKGKIMEGVDYLNAKFRGNELHISPESMPNHVREIRQYERQEGRDKPEDGNDHAMDAMRYGLHGHFRAPRRSARVW